MKWPWVVLGELQGLGGPVALWAALQWRVPPVSPLAFGDRTKSLPTLSRVLYLL